LRRIDAGNRRKAGRRQRERHRESARQKLAGGDTTRVTNQQVIQALADSLKKQKGRDIFKSLFGPKPQSPKPAPPPADTARSDSTPR
jgi:hypothetical protein